VRGKQGHHTGESTHASKKKGDTLADEKKRGGSAACAKKGEEILSEGKREKKIQKKNRRIVHRVGKEQEKGYRLCDH